MALVVKTGSIVAVNNNLLGVKHVIVLLEDLKEMVHIHDTDLALGVSWPSGLKDCDDVTFTVNDLTGQVTAFAKV